MRFAPCIAAAGLACTALAQAQEAPIRVPEPAVQRTVIEDDANRIEELKVRGQTRSAVVTTKGPLASTYEIHIGDLSRDLSDTSGAGRGAAGQRMWRVFSF